MLNRRKARIIKHAGGDLALTLTVPEYSGTSRFSGGGGAVSSVWFMYESSSSGAWHVIVFLQQLEWKSHLAGNGNAADIAGIWDNGRLEIRMDGNGAWWTTSVRSPWPAVCSEWHSTLSPGPSWHSPSSAFTSSATHLKCNYAVGEYLVDFSRKPHCSHVFAFSRNSSLMSLNYQRLSAYTSQSFLYVSVIFTHLVKSDQLTT